MKVECQNFCAVNNLSNVEIHALVGENGAGKSTAMSVLFGLNTYYQGDIFINGQHRRCIHQHFMLQNQLST